MALTGWVYTFESAMPWEVAWVLPKDAPWIILQAIISNDRQWLSRGKPVEIVAWHKLQPALPESLEGLA